MPLLKQGDYDTWRLRIESYIQLQDYALWEIIEDGNSFKPVARTTTNADGTSTSTIPGVVTAEEKIQKKNDLKARSILMMTLPSEHLLTFNQYKEAKTLFEAIEARFGDNEATKKTQKTLLKQLAILGENISQEDLNFKFLRSLPSEWSMHVVVWRNKPDLGSITFDDLYNNFMIVKQEVKRSVISSSNLSLQNVAFVSTPSSTNDVNTSNIHVSTASSSLSTASTTDNTARLSDATIYAFLPNQPNGSQRTRKKIIINGSDTVGYDKTKVECFNCHKMGHFAKECRDPRSQEYRSKNQDSSRKTVNVEESSSKALLAIDGIQRIELNKSEFDLANYKIGLAFVEEQLVFYKKNEGMLCDQIVVLKRDASFNESKINALKIQIERLKKEKESNQIKIDNFENASKSLDKLIGCQISDNNRKCVGYNVVPPPPPGLFAPPTIDLSNSGLEEFKQPKFEGYRVKMVQKPVLNNVKKGTGQREVRPVWNNTMRTNHQNFSNSRRNFAPTAVLTKSGLVPISTTRQSSSRTAATVSTVRPIKIAAPKPFVNVVKTRPNAFQKLHSPSRRPFYQQTTLKNRNLNNKVNTVKGNSVNTAKEKRVTSVVREQEINAVKSKACWRPKIKVLDHVSKNSRSYICLEFKGYLIYKRYADLRGGY
ncbi:putative ribonuclease H-like domain-containing protein [Tanacetum coccineum]